MKSPVALLIALTASTLCRAGFRESVETMKHSVVPLVCVAGDKSRFLDRRGTAFFISDAGEFLTAAHVIERMQKNESECPVWAVTLPVGEWQPGEFEESLRWFSFTMAGCTLDKDLDVAHCRLSDNLADKKLGLAFEIVPVRLEESIPPDGTEVAFTGFPMQARDPMTFRASVSANRPVWRSKKPVDELVLDRAGWPGASGAPVFLSDGRVIGILIAGGATEASSLAILRPISSIKKLLESK